MSDFLSDFEVAPDKSGPVGPTVVIEPKKAGTSNFENDFEVSSGQPIYEPYRPPEAVAARNVIGGFSRGVGDVVNTGAQGIGYLTNKITSFLADRGIAGYGPKDVEAAQKRYDALNKKVEQENSAYEAKYGDSYVASGGRIGGQLLASAPALGITGEAIPLGVAGLRTVAPSVVRAAEPYATSLLARLGVIGPASGAIGGGTVAGVTSSANPEPVGEQIKHGATTGAILGPAGPVLYEGGRYLGGAIRGLVDPFTEAGRARLANGVVADVGNNPLPVRSAEIPGYEPTLPEVTGDHGVASLYRNARDNNPSSPLKVREQEQAQARTNFLNGIRGTQQDVDAAKAQLDADANTAVKSIFKSGQSVDSAPVVAEIDSILNGPAGKRSSVQEVMNRLRSKIVNKDGSLESDPEVLYNSVRKEIGDMLDKSPSNSPAGRQAERELMQVRDVLDDRITRAVPGFDHYLTDYSSAAKPITAMKYLQGLNLTDSQGNVTLAKVDSALKSIQKQRAASGLNDAKSLEDYHIDALTTLRDNLLRAKNIDLGKARGSDTYQNAATNSIVQGLLPGKSGAFAEKLDPRLVGSGVGGSIGGFLTGTPTGAGIGASVGGLVGEGAHRLLQAQNKKVASKIEELLLNPDMVIPPIERRKNLAIERLLSLGAGGGGSSISARPPFAPAISYAQ